MSPDKEKTEEKSLSETDMPEKDGALFKDAPESAGACGIIDRGEENSPCGEEKPAISEEKTLNGEEKPAISEEKSLKKKRRAWIWNIVLVAIIALGLVILFGIAKEITAEDGKSFSEVMSGINYPSLAVLVCVVLGAMTADCLKFCIVNKAVTGKVRIKVAVKTNFLGKFYDAITPFSTGGQPAQIYYMVTKGVKVADSSAVVLIRYFASIFTFTLVGAVCMISGVVFGVLDGVAGKNILLAAGWIGLAVNLVLPVFLVFFVLFPRMAHKLTALAIGIGARLRIVKDKEKAMGKAVTTVTEFTASIRIIVARPLYLLLLLAACFAETLLTFSVPYFVMQALSCEVSGMFFSVMILNVFTTFGVSFIPTPGNSGVVEGMGVLAFSLAAGATLAWSVLFWRFSVYYLYIFIGIVLTVCDLIIKNIKSYKRKKKNG